MYIKKKIISVRYQDRSQQNKLAQFSFKASQLKTCHLKQKKCYNNSIIENSIPVYISYKYMIHSVVSQLASCREFKLLLYTTVFANQQTSSSQHSNAFKLLTIFEKVHLCQQDLRGYEANVGLKISSFLLLLAVLWYKHSMLHFSCFHCICLFFFYMFYIANVKNYIKCFL